ncbi:5-formyltetrahydrofolate cyclo-ligase [Deferribacter thermophilus]|uniref:5-formyltetrahydrofolate cyclo-ligase n=1 Tax=Deferribacter thermophilus TaxID=53573 RepID=UPI003C147C53
MKKNELREKYKKLRNELDEFFIEKASATITEKFIRNFSNYNSYLLYLSFNNEVRTIKLIEYLKDNGKEVFLPVVYKERLTVGCFEGFKDLVPGKYGIREPKRVSSVDNFDVVVVPGVVFDNNCYRLGYGKGYYDRFLKSIYAKVLIGFAYDFQVVEKLPVESHDVKLDFVLTEKREIGGN